MSTVYQAKIPMTPDIQEFLHAMHDNHAVTDEKQSLRNGTSGYIPLFNQPKPIQKMIHRMNAAISALIGHKDWGYIGLWSNRLPKGGFHVRHTHPKGWISGICYIDIPENDSGHLRFDDRIVIPDTGDVVIFDSQTPHEVTEYHGEKPRLAVAFDLIPVNPRA